MKSTPVMIGSAAMSPASLPAGARSVEQRVRRHQRLLEPGQLVDRHRVRVLEGRERSRPDIVRVAADAVDGGLVEVGVALHEPRCPGVAVAEQVVVDQHLAVAAGAGADADGRDLEAFGDRLRDRCRHALEHQREGAGGLDRQRVVDQLQRGGGGPALRLVAAERGRRLRRQAEVAHHRDAGARDGQDAVERRAGALHLHAVGATLLDEPAGRHHGIRRFYNCGEASSLDHSNSDRHNLSQYPYESLKN